MAGEEASRAESATAPAIAPTAEDEWAALGALPCKLSVAVSVPGFTVRDLLVLDVGSLVETQTSATGSVPVWVNGVKIARAEFDVLRANVAIRIGELE